MTKIAARPTTYKGIRMRSRLEAGYAAWLDKWGFTWEYEPQCFATERGQYLPDFLLHNVPIVDGDPRRNTESVYVEVKPFIDVDDLPNLAERMAIIHAATGCFNSRLILEIPGQQPRELFTNPFVSGPAGRWHKAAWAYHVAWAQQEHTGRENGDEYLALAMTLDRDTMPWPDGYWNVNR